jgi:hypothetical protein
VDSTVELTPPSLRELREAFLRLAERHGASDVRVFGSVTRGEAIPGSDVDFLVTMEPGRSLFDLGGLLMDLRDLLGRAVDVATPSSLTARVRARALRESVAL